MITHFEVRDLIPPYALNILDDEDAARVRAHLHGCRFCARLAHEASSVVDFLAYAPRLQRPPEHGLERLLRTVNADKIAPPARTMGHTAAAVLNGLEAARRSVVQSLRGLVRMPRRRTIPLGAGALAAVALSLWNVVLMSQLRDVQAQEDGIRNRLTHQSEALLMATSGQLVVRRLWPTALAPNAQVILMIESSGSGAMLMAMHLPSLPREHVYETWLSKGSARHGVGRFMVDERGNAEANLSLPPDPLSVYDSAWITIEPTQGTPTPNSPGIARGLL